MAVEVHQAAAELQLQLFREPRRGLQAGPRLPLFAQRPHLPAAQLRLYTASAVAVATLARLSAPRQPFALP